MRNKFIIIATISLSALFSACESENKEELFPVDPAVVCTTDSMSFSMDINPIIAKNCAISGCHVSGFNDGDFTTYQGIKDKIDNGDLIRERVVIKKDMPASGPLPDCEINKIKSWLDAGAPNN
jgi:hypothetical protein